MSLPGWWLKLSYISVCKRVSVKHRMNLLLVIAAIVSMEKVQSCWPVLSDNNVILASVVVFCSVEVLMAFGYASSLTRKAKGAPLNKAQMPVKVCSQEGAVWFAAMMLVPSSVAAGPNGWKFRGGASSNSGRERSPNRRWTWPPEQIRAAVQI